MAFTPIDPNDIQPGLPVRAELMELVRTNFDDHESRISATEAAFANTVPLEFQVWGKYTSVSAPNLDVASLVIPFDLTFVGCLIYNREAGTAGTLEIDLRSGDAGGPYTTIFTTRPSLAFGTGDEAVSVNAIIDATNSTALAGQVLKLDITSHQTGPDINGFLVVIQYTVS